MKVTIEFDNPVDARRAIDLFVPSPAPVRVEAPEATTEPAETEPQKRKRRTKAEIEAEKAAAEAAKKEPAAPAPTVDDDPFGETPAPAAAAKLTIEDVREAMKTYQATVKAKLIAGGKAEEDARKESLEVARGLLGKVSGSQIFGDLKEEQYAAVVEAAKAATAKV